MLRAFLFILFLTTSLLPLQAGAWGREGHAIVAEVAMGRLTKPAKAQVERLLAGMPPEDAAEWMDDVKRQKPYRYMQHWHYINIPEGGSYQPGGHDDIIYALQLSSNYLKSSPGTDSLRREALLVLLHLVGDLHQPLHTGYASDKGGNKMQVNIGGRKGTNLHHLWDSDVIERQDITLETVLQYGRTLSPAAVKAIQNGDFVSWMTESRGYLPQVYNFSGHKVDDAYMRSAQTLVARQLFVAGVRLAAVLNTIFSKSAVRTNKIQGK